MIVIDVLYILLILLLIVIISMILPFIIFIYIKLGKEICKNKIRNNFLEEVKDLKVKIANLSRESKLFYDQLVEFKVLFDELCNAKRNPQHENQISSSSDIIVNKVAYNDAVRAFNNINNDLYGIRKYQYACSILMESMSKGKEADLNMDEVPKSEKEKIAGIRSSINLFNKNYRIHIVSYLQSQGLTWEACVRFPYNQLYNPDWDEDILGNTIEEGTIIQRVVQLGFEFPDSIILGRVKSKIITE